MITDPRNAYRQYSAGGNQSLHLVVLLYEQIIEDVRRAVAALESGDVERRTAEINHALLVIGQLQGTLNLDEGGEVARNLDRFYESLRRRVLEGQISASRKILEQQMLLVMEVREAWVEVERQSSVAAPLPTRDFTEPASTPKADWRG